MFFESIALWRASSYQWRVSLLGHSIKHLVVRDTPQHIYHYLRERIIMTSPIYKFKVSLHILFTIFFCLSHEYMIFEQLIFPSFDDCLKSLTLYLHLPVWINVNTVSLLFVFCQRLSRKQKGHILLEIILAFNETTVFLVFNYIMRPKGHRRSSFNTYSCSCMFVVVFGIKKCQRSW